MVSIRVFCAILVISCSSGFIIPNELPTILSLVYSNIPPLKIGTDNRFGIGFRLGPHADFQTLIEVGPQINTGKIAEDTPAKRDSTREVPKSNPIIPGNSQDSKIESAPSQIIIPISDDPKPKKTPPKKTKSPFIEKIVFKKVPGIDN